MSEGYPSSSRPASDLALPPKGPAPGAAAFTQKGWWHDDPNVCNHFKTDQTCTNTGGTWLPVYVMEET